MIDVDIARGRSGWSRLLWRDVIGPFPGIFSPATSSSVPSSSLELERHQKEQIYTYLEFFLQKVLTVLIHLIPLPGETTLQNNNHVSKCLPTALPPRDILSAPQSSLYDAPYPSHIFRDDSHDLSHKNFNRRVARCHEADGEFRVCNAGCLFPPPLLFPEVYFSTRGQEDCQESGHLL